MRAKANTCSAETFESSLLREIASAIARRGKAIRHHGHLSCSCTVEDSIERLNVEFASLSAWRVRLSVWPDGVLWLSVLQAGARRTGGWAHRDEFHSRMENLDAHAVVERFEQTIHAPHQARSFWPVIDSQPGNNI